jgi:hypothetical protein
VSVSVHQDTVRLRLQHNAAIAVLYAFFLGLTACGLFATASVIQSPSFLLLGAVLGGAVAAAIVTVARNRRRLHRALDLPGPYVTVSGQGVAAAGLPLIPWSEVLGVVIGRRDHPLTSRNTMATLAEWSARVSGRSLVGVLIGVRAPQRYVAGRPAHGPIEVVNEATGLLVLDLDTVLRADDGDRLRTALQEAAAEAGVAFLELSESSEISRARQAMRTGEPLRGLR